MIVSVALSFSGLASLVDGFYRWGAFFSDIVELYRYWVLWIFIPLDDLFKWLGWSFPVWAKDVVVAWIAVGGVGYNLTEFFFGESKTDTLTERLTVKVYNLLLAPLTAVFFVMSSFKRVIKGHFNLRPSLDDIMYFYALSIFVCALAPLFLALFIDWQFLDQ